MGELGQGALKLTLAKVAPGTGEIGPYLYLHALFNEWVG
jgi:hypothetical protein